MEKANWSESRQHYIDWWNHRGVVLGHWESGIVDPSKDTAVQPVPASLEFKHTDPAFREEFTTWDLGRRTFPEDTLPFACPGLQTVELASYLGAGLSFDKDTIWYESAPEFDYEVVFDSKNQWYTKMIETLGRQAELCRDRYIPSLPGISPNLDVLAELRGAQNFLMDLIERPDEVKSANAAIDTMFLDIFDRFGDIIQQPDGGSAFYYFMLWAPGKVTQLQCDVAAMFSPGMFEEFAMPGFRNIADRIEYTLFHVDGPPMLKHVDALLSIEGLDAIEFTPGPGVPTGADPHWYDLYRKILDAGKSVQVVVEKIENIEPLLRNLGGNGIYLLTNFFSGEKLQAAGEIVAKYRP